MNANDLLYEYENCMQVSLSEGLKALSGVLDKTFEVSGSNAESSQVVLATALLTTYINSSGSSAKRDDDSHAFVQSILENALLQLQVELPDAFYTYLLARVC